MASISKLTSKEQFFELQEEFDHKALQDAVSSIVHLAIREGVSNTDMFINICYAYSEMIDAVHTTSDKIGETNEK